MAIPADGMGLSRREQILSGAVAGVSAAIYAWSFYALGQPFSPALLLILALPLPIYFWYFRNGQETERDRADVLSHRAAAVLPVYAFVYFAATYVVNVLASSAALWLVQFLIPASILKLYREPLSHVNFRWRWIFRDFGVVALSALLLIPTLVFVVRDSEQILTMAASWRGPLFLVISVIFMMLIVAFWEEFFFRGVLMSSFLRLTGSPATAIFVSALLFGTYHLPMRYMNARSEYFGNLYSSLAATINEQFILGLFVGLIVYKSKNVWHGVWLHGLVNGLSYVYKMTTVVKF